MERSGEIGEQKKKQKEVVWERKRVEPQRREIALKEQKNQYKTSLENAHLLPVRFLLVTEQFGQARRKSEQQWLLMRVCVDMGGNIADQHKL